MTKRPARLSFLIAILLIGVISWGTVGLVRARTIPAASASIPVIKYWLETAQSEAVITSAFIAAGGTPVATTDRAAADLLIQTATTPGATGILPASIGTPKALTSSQIIAPSSQPTAYAVPGPHTAHPDIMNRAITSLTHATPAKDPDWTMTVVGDIGFGRSIYNSMAARNNFLYPFQAFKSELQSADLAIANLECALSDDHAVITNSGMTFVAPFRGAAGLKDSGFDAVSIANNHSFNGGAEGYLDTLAELQRLGITAIGGGRDDAQAHAPQILTAGGQRVALLAYSAIAGSQPASATTPGMAYISMAPWGPFSETDVARMEADIKAARTKADVVMVYYHWGTEYTHDANADQRTVAHRAIDAGADVILGAHPHWVQGVEWYNGHLITYSLGNFIFDQAWSDQTRQGTVLKLSFEGRRLQSAQLVPYDIVQNLKPQPATTNAQQILSDVFDHSWWPQPD